MIEFVRTNTAVSHAPLVPEIRLHLATEITPIWRATETWLQQQGCPPPYWAFAWPGSQAIARHALDHPDAIAGRRVLDFACGGGLAGLACPGALTVEANDIDPVAIAAVQANAALNDRTITAAAIDLVGTSCRWDLILCGDICYEAPMTRHILPWLRAMAAQAEVWIADPGRAYLPEGLVLIAEYAVPTSIELEDRTERHTRILRL